jgi:hypothetical protein
MTSYAIAFNLYAIIVALFCLFLAIKPVRKPCAKQAYALARFNRVYNVRCNNAAYARACRNIALIPPTTIPLSISHIKQQLEQNNYGHTVASKLAIAKHQARLAVIASKLELRGYYDN